MADISKFDVNGTVYGLKDEVARKATENIPTTVATAVEQYLTENPPSGTVSTEEIKAAVTEYLTENPPSGETETDIVNAVNAYMEENAESFKGEPGENGVTPNLTIGTVETLAAGSNATASIEGTAENLLLNLGIPQGAKGASGSGTGTDVLDGKKILFVGDSICEGVGAKEQPYPYWIQQWHPNTTVYNLGVGGMTIAQKDSSITNAMPVRIASAEFENSDYANPDIIVFEGGINDLMNNVKLGYIQNSYTAEKFNTFCRGMEYMFSYFKGLFPKARMLFLSTHYVTAYDYNKSKSWWGAASEICAKWGIEFLDIFSLLCTKKIEGLQLHPDYLVHENYYAKYIEMALTASCPISGARTTNYYKQNAPCMLQFYSGTKSINIGEIVNTSGWRINMIRADLTTYANVSSSVTYDISDVDNTIEGTYPVHVAYSEDGITLAIDVDVTVAGESTEKTLDSISADKTTTSYTVGSTVSTSDITVTASYTDGTTADVTKSSTFDTSNINNSSAGEYNIAVSYTENGITKTTSIQISIVQSGATTVVASGTARDKNNSETVTWSLDSNGTITFDCSNSNTTIATYNDGEQPWHDYIGQITKAIFTSNIINTGGNVLLGATALASVELQNNSVEIGSGAFNGCTSLAQTDWTKAKSIGTYALKGCSMDEITFGTTSLAMYAFHWNSITKVTWTGTPESINSNAFYSTNSLTDIYVPWSEGAVANAPWGATGATINYSYTAE